MPVHRGIDSIGSFYQYGNQKKYYYIPGDRRSRYKANRNAKRQGQAIKTRIIQL